MGENRQLLCRVGSVDIHRRIRFGVAQFLSLFDHRIVRRTDFIHLTDDEVAGPIQDAFQGLQLVGRQTLANVRNNGNPTGDRSFERDAASQLPSPIEQLRTMLGK